MDLILAKLSEMSIVQAKVEVLETQFSALSVTVNSLAIEVRTLKEQANARGQKDRGLNV